MIHVEDVVRSNHRSKKIFYSQIKFKMLINKSKLIWIEVYQKNKFIKIKITKFELNLKLTEIKCEIKLNSNSFLIHK